MQEYRVRSTDYRGKGGPGTGGKRVRSANPARGRAILYPPTANRYFLYWVGAWLRADMQDYGVRSTEYRGEGGPGTGGKRVRSANPTSMQFCPYHHSGPRSPFVPDSLKMDRTARGAAPTATPVPGPPFQSSLQPASPLGTALSGTAAFPYRPSPYYSPKVGLTS